jgi:hypothetical protein
VCVRRGKEGRVSGFHLTSNAGEVSTLSHHGPVICFHTILNFMTQLVQSRKHSHEINSIFQSNISLKYIYIPLLEINLLIVTGLRDTQTSTGRRGCGRA